MKTEAQAIFLICLPLAHRANGYLSFVRLLTKKKKGNYQVAKGLNRLNGLN
jgi:hypothetical protein